MKILIAFYSLTGNTKRLAQAIAQATDGETLEIELKKKIPRGFLRYFWGGRQVMIKEAPAILPFEKNPNDYDLIFIGTPIWAGNFVPALRSFLEQTKLQKKRIAFFAAHGGGPEKTFERLKKEVDKNGVGNEIVGEVDFKMQGIAPDQKRKNLEETGRWAKTIVSK